MTYANWKDVEDRYPEIAKGPDPKQVSSSYLIFVDAELNGLFAGAYTVPFSDNNLTIKDLAVDLTYIKMSVGKSEKREEIKKRFEERISRIKDGEESMLNADGTAITINGLIWSSTEDYHPVFGMDDTINFAVDSSQIEDERAARE